MAINQNDVISAKEGTVFVTIGAQTYEMATVKSVIATTELKIADVQVINQRMDGGKVVGATGTGTLVYQYHSPQIRKLIHDFIKTGAYPDVSIKGTNADVTSRAGRQSVLIKGVIFESAKVFELDGTSDDVLEDETPFRFNDVDYLETFKII